MRNKNEIIFNPTVLVALGTAYIYFCSFIFEWAQCNVYDIPLSFISPSLNIILVLSVITLASLSVIFGILVSIYSLLIPLFRNWTNGGLVFISVVFIVLVLMSLITLDIFASKINGIVDILISFALAFFLIIATFFFLFILTKVSEWIENAYKGKYSDFEANRKNEKFVKKHTMSIVLVLTFYPFIVFLYGINSSLTRKYYPVLTSHPTIAVVKKYDDILLCKPFLVKQHVLKDSLIVIKISDKVNIVMQEEKIGPLTRAKDY